MTKILSVFLASVFLLGATPALADGGYYDCGGDSCRRDYKEYKPVKQPKCYDYDCYDRCNDCGSNERISIQYDYSYRYESDGRGNCYVRTNDNGYRRSIPCDDRYSSGSWYGGNPYYYGEPYANSYYGSYDGRVFPSLPTRPERRSLSYDDRYYGDYYGYNNYSGNYPFPSLPTRPPARYNY